jgi:arginine/ornithine transport system substrate-binding protein
VADIVEVQGGFLDTADGKGYVFVGEPLSEKKYFGDGMGVAVRKGDKDLKEALNKAIAAIRADGTWQKISDKYVPGVNIWGK